MKWLVFTYSLPTRLNTGARVKIWRQLRKSGAVSPKSGVYILPNQGDCLEALRWLVSEVEHAQGEALVMEVTHFENMTDEQLIDIFRKMRATDYHNIEGFLQELEHLITSAKEKRADNNTDNVLVFKRDIQKIKRNINEVARIDFFQACDKRVLLDRLHRLQKKLVTGNLILAILLSSAIMETTVLRTLQEESPKVSRKKDNFKVKHLNEKLVNAF